MNPSVARSSKPTPSCAKHPSARNVQEHDPNDLVVNVSLHSSVHDNVWGPGDYGVVNLD